MPKPDSRTPDPPTPAGPDSEREAARRAAIAALLHRLNGGLNNAALAFELELSKSENDKGIEHVLERGLAGVEQASRAATLLALLLDPTALPPASSTGPYAQDVVEILRAHARRMGSGVDPEFDISSLSEDDRTPAATAEALLAGLAELQRTASR